MTVWWVGVGVAGCGGVGGYLGFQCEELHPSMVGGCGRRISRCSHCLQQEGENAVSQPTLSLGSHQEVSPRSRWAFPVAKSVNSEVNCHIRAMM